MKNNRILVPYDFTDAAIKAASVAASVAKEGHFAMTLLHIAHKSSDTGTSLKLQEHAEKLQEDYKISCNYIVREGKIISEIIAASHEFGYVLMVIGSQGYKGFIEKLHGMDLLKLVKEIPFPVLTVQETYQMPEAGIKTIILPGSSHKDYMRVVDACIFIASIYGSRVVVYTVEKPGFTWSETLRSNLRVAMEEFEARGIDYERVNESQSTYSAGYARQILQYAGKEKADLIAVMSIPTNEYYHIADSDKEQLLVNNLKIPVLGASDKRRL